MMMRTKKLFTGTGKLIITLFLFYTQTIVSQPEGTKSSDIVENVKYNVVNGRVMINYDLEGNADETYKVFLTLRRTGNSNIIYTPISVSGDIGEGHFAGSGRQIIWDMSKDFPEGLSGEDYYFVINATETSSSISSLVWIGIGVAAAAGAVAAFIFSHNGNGSSQEKVPSFPMPPGRP
jgi:hypothetical protein